MIKVPRLWKPVWFLLLLCCLVQISLAGQVQPDYRFRVEDDGGLYFLFPDEEGKYLDLLDSGTQSPSRFEVSANQQNEVLSLMKPDQEEGARPGLVKVFASRNIRMRVFMGDASALGIPLSVELQNISPAATSIGFSVLLNTVLGESGDSHFSIMEGSVRSDLENESKIASASGLKVLVSGDVSRRGHMLAIPVGYPDQENDLPETVYCANMFRLTGAEGAYGFVAGRNFSYLPFSVNDSGLRLVYPESVLLPGQIRHFSLVLAWAVPGNDDFLALLRASRIFRAPEQKKSGTVPVQKEKSISERLAELNSLIKRLDAITRQKNYSQAELERIMERLQEIEAENQETAH